LRAQTEDTHYNFVQKESAEAKKQEASEKEKTKRKHHIAMQEQRISDLNDAIFAIYQGKT